MTSPELSEIRRRACPECGAGLATLTLGVPFATAPTCRCHGMSSLYAVTCPSCGAPLLASVNTAHGASIGDRRSLAAARARQDAQAREAIAARWERD